MMPMVADAFAFDRRIHDGKLLQRDHGRAGKKRHEGQTRSVALSERRFSFVAQLNDAGQVNFEHAMNVGAGAAGFDHAVGNDLTHLGHGHKIARNCGRRGRSGAFRFGRGSSGGGRRLRRLTPIEKSGNVLFGDATAEPGAGYLPEIDIVLPRDFSDQG